MERKKVRLCSLGRTCFRRPPMKNHLDETRSPRLTPLTLMKKTTYFDLLFILQLVMRPSLCSPNSPLGRTCRICSIPIWLASVGFCCSVLWLHSRPVLPRCITGPPPTLPPAHSRLSGTIRTTTTPPPRRPNLSPSSLTLFSYATRTCSFTSVKLSLVP